MKFIWRFCSNPSRSRTANEPFTWQEGGRTLTVAEFGVIDELLSVVQTSSSTRCPVADATEYRLTVTTPAGEKKYLDETYACEAAAQKLQPVTSLSTLFAELTRRIE